MSFQLTLLSAKDVKDDDGAFNKSDPYFLFKVNGQEYKSKVDNNDDDPTFNQKFQVNCGSDSTLVVECWDQDTTNKDDIIGSHKISVRDIMSRLEQEGSFAEEYKLGSKFLNRKMGMVNLEFSQGGGGQSGGYGGGYGGGESGGYGGGQSGGYGGGQSGGYGGGQSGGYDENY